MKKATRRRLMERKIVEYLVSGKGFNEICQQLKVGRKRVANIREKARSYGYVEGNTPIPPYPEALFPNPIDKRTLKISEADIALQEHKGWIEERIISGWQPVTVYEELPIKTGRSSFYRFLHRYNLYSLSEDIRRTVIPEIIHQPGEALIVDWGKLREVVDLTPGKKKILWMFVGIMGYSRYMMVRLVWSNDLASTITAIESMLKEIGGVPARITSDNPKCFVIQASKYEPLLNPVFERFAAHYGMQIECLPPRSPELKGKVERMISFVRRLYQAHGEGWSGLEESQEFINKKTAIANERIHGTTRRKPIDLFLEKEVAALKSLPALSYEPEEFTEAKVRQDGHVRFRDKYYSVDGQYNGKEVMIIADKKQVAIYHQGKLLEVHERIIDPHKTKSTKATHLPPWEQFLQDNEHYRKKASKLGEHVEKVVVNILKQGNGFVDTRKIWGILSLDKKYSAGEINEACERAIGVGSYSYRTIMALLLIKGAQSEILPKTSCSDKSGKFVRPIIEYKKQLAN